MNDIDRAESLIVIHNTQLVNGTLTRPSYRSTDWVNIAPYFIVRRRPVSQRTINEWNRLPGEWSNGIDLPGECYIIYIIDNYQKALILV